MTPRLIFAVLGIAAAVASLLFAPPTAYLAVSCICIGVACILS